MAADLARVVLAGALTALATGVGAIPVFAVRRPSPALSAWLGGCAIGAMLVASFAGLLLPALRNGSPSAAAAATGIGAAFVLFARSRLEHHARAGAARSRRSLLVFAVLLVHSFPEGLAVGAAWASHTEGLALFVVVGIALQN